MGQPIFRFGRSDASFEIFIMLKVSIYLGGETRLSRA